MTFGPDHYVPILKVKRGEKKALSQLEARILERLTPLLEIVETRGTPLGRHLDTAFTGIDVALKNVKRYFLDARELRPEGSHAALAVFARARSLSVPFIPVTGISRSFDTAAAIKAARGGIALRLTRTEFDQGRQGGLKKLIAGFLQRHGIDEANIDLLVDIGPVDDMIRDGVRDLATQFLRAIPNSTRWRTLTLLGSAFPKSMGLVGRQSHDFADRNEWLVWRDELYPIRRSLDRMPTFGDCAIQHPAGVEGFDPRIMKASAAVRYTLDEQWLLVKGVSTGVTNPSAQFPKLAAQIVSGSLSRYYAGTSHCAGCEAMKRSAAGAPGLGSAEAWRRLGTIHHLTRTTEQIAHLAWP